VGCWGGGGGGVEGGLQPRGGREGPQRVFQESGRLPVRGGGLGEGGGRTLFLILEGNKAIKEQLTTIPSLIYHSMLTFLYSLLIC
jgi:hypothetical protein